jgi:hypothetical protein
VTAICVSGHPERPSAPSDLGYQGSVAS